MQNWHSRASVVFFHALTVLFVAGLGSALTALFHSATPTAQITGHKVLGVGRDRYFPVEQALLAVDIDADLSSLWNWNVHQVFAFLVAEVATPGFETRRMTVWDRVLQDSKSSKFSVASERLEYPVSDELFKLRGADVTLTLFYDVHPIMGSIKRANASAPYPLRIPAAR